jgi:hypothetical protein
MRVSGPAISILIASLCTGHSAEQQLPKSAAVPSETNAVVCALSIKYAHEPGKSPLFCNVTLLNSSPRYRLSFLRLPPEMSFAIDLVDANGKSVDKTEYGRKFGLALSQREINDWFQSARKGRGGWAGWFWLTSAELQTVGAFSMSQAFKIDKPGEYLLHVRLRLVQSSLIDPSGTVKRKSIFDGQYFRNGKSDQVGFQETWLPEATGTVQVRSEDIPPAKVLPGSQTNSPAK